MNWSVKLLRANQLEKYWANSQLTWWKKSCTDSVHVSAKIVIKSSEILQSVANFFVFDFFIGFSNNC